MHYEEAKVADGDEVEDLFELIKDVKVSQRWFIVIVIASRGWSGGKWSNILKLSKIESWKRVLETQISVFGIFVAKKSIRTFARNDRLPNGCQNYKDLFNGTQTFASRQINFRALSIFYHTGKILNLDSYIER